MAIYSKTCLATCSGFCRIESHRHNIRVEVPIVGTNSFLFFVIVLSNLIPNWSNHVSCYLDSVAQFLSISRNRLFVYSGCFNLLLSHFWHSETFSTQCTPPSPLFCLFGIHSSPLNFDLKGQRGICQTEVTRSVQLRPQWWTESKLSH